MEENVERPDRFRKLKELAQNVKANETVKQVKLHLIRNKKTYIVGGIGVTITISVLVLKSRPIHITNSPVFNNLPVINNTVNSGGPMYKIVQDIDNPHLVWPKMKYLAKEIAEKHDITFDSARTRLWRQINGFDDNLYGHRYVIIGHGPGI
jgi:hypothetical protein